MPRRKTPLVSADDFVTETTVLPADPHVVKDALGPLINPTRLALLEKVLSQRTLEVVPVFENIADPHNAAAVLRSAEAFGLIHVHVIEHEHSFRAGRGVTQGSHHWLDLKRHSTPEECVSALRAQHYHIAYTEMNAEKGPLDLDQKHPWAIVFGNEGTGVSPKMRELADEAITIPMYGFVESLNLSVAAALTLHDLSRRAQRGLPQAEYDHQLARYMMASVTRAEEIVLEHQRRQAK